MKEESKRESVKQSPKKTRRTGSEVSAAQVATYLARHPGFFRRRLELLAGIEVPHDVEGAVSLIESQVRVLRDENLRLRAERRELLEAVHANEALARRLHGALLGLLEVDTLEQFLDRVDQHLPRRLSVQTVKLVLFVQEPGPPADSAARPEFEGSDPAGHPQYAHLLKTGKPRALLLDRGEAILYFGEDGEELHSAVSLPLRGRSWQGLLLVGSGSPERFSGEVRFEMMEAFAQVLGGVLDRWLGASA